MSRLSSSTSRTQVPDTEQTWNAPTPPNDEESALPPKEKEDDGKDPNIVDWEGDNDRDNPRNWSNSYKSWVTLQLGMLALCASLGSSITSPAQNAIAEYVGVSNEVVVLSVSLYM
jgi:hypothetical protein